jgi:hypothetical protein
MFVVRVVKTVNIFLMWVELLDAIADGKYSNHSASKDFIIVGPLLL